MMRMGKFAQLGLIVAACTLSAARPVSAQGTLDVIGLNGKKTPVSLAGLERRSISTADAAGIKTTHEGVAMRDVLGKAGVQLGNALRGKAMAQVILATAQDGYQVAFAIAEVDEGFTDHLILISDMRNGKPLLPDSGPLQIVVPQDKRGARSMKQVLKLEVKQLQ